MSEVRHGGRMLRGLGLYFVLPVTADRRERILDVVVCLMLLLPVLVLFREAVIHPNMSPRGMDFSQHYSREVVVRWALQTTWIPLWNPYEFGGFPIQADLQTGIFYPLSMILRLLPVASFLTWTTILHIWIFGIGSYLLCRVFGIGRGASAVAGIGLMLGGIMLPRVYAGHLDVLRTVAWVPLSLTLAIDSLNRRSIAPSPAAVFVLAMMVLAGFLQLVVYTVLAVALYAAYAAVWPPSGERSVRGAAMRVAQLGTMVLLVLGVTAFQLVPTYRLVMEAGRAGGMPLETAIIDAVQVRNLGMTMFAAAPEGAVPYESWESSAYIGWLLAALAPLGAVTRRQRRRVGFFIVLAGFALWLATGGYLFALHHVVFPMFRIPGRFMSFWAIAVGVLGASALDGFRRWTNSRSRVVKIAGQVALFAASLVVLADLASYDTHFLDISPLREQFASSAPLDPPEFGRVLSLCEGALSTSELTALGFLSVDGYNSYFLGDYAHLAQRVRGDPLDDQQLLTPGRHTAFPRMGALGTIQDLEALSVLNVTDVVSCGPLDMPGLEFVERSGQFYVYRNQRAFGRVAVTCPPEQRTPGHDLGVCRDNAQIAVQRADTPTGELRIRVAQPRSNLLWLAEPYYPERRAWVDGVSVPLEKHHIGLSSIRIDAGVHLAELRFVPTSLYYGTATSLSVIALWCGTVLWAGRKRYTLTVGDGADVGR
jgi:hypothetical protein